MSITYPRGLPSLRIERVYFEPQHQDAPSPEQGGRFVSTELGPALWELQIGTQPPSETEFSLWRAWLASLRGSSRRFYGHDPRRRLPWNYRTGFAGLVRAQSEGAFDGTSTSWTVNTGRDEITIGAASDQELPVGFTLTIGDYIGLKKGTLIRSVHRVLDEQNADANGVATLSIEPPVHPSFPADATLNLVAPEALMVVTKKEAEATGKARRVSLEAVQSLELTE